MKRGRGRPRLPVEPPGHKFNNWTLIDPTRDEKGRVLVECRCQRRRRVCIYSLRHNASRQCQSCSNTASAPLVLRVDEGDKFGIWRVAKTCIGRTAMVPLVCKRGHASRRVLHNLLDLPPKRCKRCVGGEISVAGANKYAICKGERYTLRSLVRLRGSVVIHADSIEFGLVEEKSLRDEVTEIIQDAPGVDPRQLLRG